MALRACKFKHSRHGTGGSACKAPDYVGVRPSLKMSRSMLLERAVGADQARPRCELGRLKELNREPERGPLVGNRPAKATQSNMEVPGNISRKAKREWQHGKLAQNTIAAQRLHVCSGPGEHGLHQAEGILRDVFKKRSGEGFETIKVVDELDFKVRLRAGLDQCSAPVQSEESKKLKPCGAFLRGVVHDGQHSDAVPENAHHNQGHSLWALQLNRNSIDE